jgi:transcriptional regulator with XRE-family HTH domain
VNSTAGAGLADRLNGLRVREALSLSEVARRARISKAYLSQLERGESTQPSYDVLLRLATALGTTPQALAGGSLPVPSSSDGSLPETLRDFAARSEIPDVDVSMLANIHYRGKQPATAEDWAHIYETIKRTIR